MLNRTTLARPYARAAFQAARERDALAPWSDCLAIAAMTAADPGIKPLLKDPRLTREQRLELFTGVGEGRYDESFANFLRVLVTYGRLELLPDIHVQYEALRREAEARVHVLVTSAQAVDDEEAARLGERLKARFGREIDLEIEIDPELIGGAVIRAGDQVIDGSVRGRIERLARQVAH